jgi:hypothetical protein
MASNYQVQIDEYRERRLVGIPPNNVDVIEIELQNRDLALARQL